MLVHCLAGAHRAGTTGIISLMHFQVEGDDKDEDEGDEDHEDILVQGLDSSEAIKRAKSRRPIIEPIGDFRSEKIQSTQCLSNISGIPNVIVCLFRQKLLS